MAAQLTDSGTTRAGSFADCVRAGADGYFEAKAAFQRDLRDLIVAKRPAFDSLATISMELQILLTEARRLEVDYLLTRDGGRIDTNNGIVRFSNFDWSEQDSANLRSENDSYRELENRISALRRRNDDHPDWPELRTFFHSELNGSPDFEAIMVRFQARQNDAEQAIAQCHRD